MSSPGGATAVWPKDSPIPASCHKCAGWTTGAQASRGDRGDVGWDGRRSTDTDLVNWGGRAVEGAVGDLGDTSEGQVSCHG